MYILSTTKIISSYDVVFDEILSSLLAFTSQPYSEAMAMRPSATYTLCATSPREQTGDIITFKIFEERIFISETCNDAESSEKPDDNSIMPPMLSEEEIDAMDSGDNYNRRSYG